VVVVLILCVTLTLLPELRRRGADLEQTPLAGVPLAYVGDPGSESARHRWLVGWAVDDDEESMERREEMVECVLGQRRMAITVPA
jgi:hypothetical protein